MSISLQTIVDKWDAISQDTTLATQLDITLSALRDAIVDVGGDATSTKDLLDKLETIRALLAGAVTVTGTVAVSATALPAGASTAAAQASAENVLDDILLKVTASAATEAKQDDIITELTRDLRGLAVDKPDPTLHANKTYWSVDTGQVEVSDGTSWVVV